MNAHLAGGLLLVAVVTVLVFLLGWHANNWCLDRRAARRLAERAAAERAALEHAAAERARAPMPTYRGWLFDTAWHPVQRDTAPMSMIDALEIADAAYQLGHQRAEADQVHAEAEAIWAEVDADPGRWQT